LRNHPPLRASTIKEEEEKVEKMVEDKEQKEEEEAEEEGPLVLFLVEWNCIQTNLNLKMV